MTLRTKLNRSVTALFLFVIICLSVTMYYQQQQKLERMGEKVSVFLETISRNNSLSLANELFENRFQAIELRLSNIVNIRGIECAEVYGTDKKRLVGVGEKRSLTSQLPEPGDTGSFHLDDSILVFAIQIKAYGDTFGLLVLYYPLDDIHKEEWLSFVLFTAGYLLFLLLTLLLLNIITHKNVVYPLHNMIAAMGNVRQGSLEQVVETGGSDEIQKLTDTFSQMTQDLAKGYQELEHANLFTEQLLDTIDSILFAIDSRLKINTLNNAAVTYVGKAKENIIGQQLIDILPIIESLHPRIIGAIKTGKPDFLYRYTIDETFFNVFISPLTGQSLGGALIRLDDITQQEEQESQLRQIQKMETIGLVVGGVAHDFNNMLTGILGAAQLLNVHIHDPKIKRYVNMITQTGKRASDLTAKLLAFGRKTTMEKVAVDIHQVIEAAVDLLSRSIARTVTINIELGAAQSTLEGDFTELQSCLINLGVNAAHSMPNGGVIAIITRDIKMVADAPEITTFNLKPGDYVELEVRDSGVGIAPEHLQSIFEPFFTTKERGRGTGLGLAAVYGSVKQMGGAITVHSIQGIGTSFHLLFPVSYKAVECTNVQSPYFTTGIGRILVVDDEEVLRDTAKGLLESLGYHVDLACNGEVAVQTLKEHPLAYDLVFLDVIMPKMNGIDCFYALRKIEPHLKIVLSSGFPQDADLEQLKSDGLVGYIRKPYDLEELGRVVTKFLV